jgi:glycerol-3-phosphate acyltransferase PlsY
LVGASYGLGTFPAADLVARALGRDVHAEGSGNPGASNVYRLAGGKAAALVLLADAAKGAVPTFVGLHADGTNRQARTRSLALACGGAAVLGHCFPPHRRGGKGVATAAGMISVIEPGLAVGAAVLWAAVAKGLGQASVASLTVAGSLPLAMLARRRPAGEIGAVTLLAAFVAVRHAPNLRRLVRGEEPGMSNPG